MVKFIIGILALTFVCASELFGEERGWRSYDDVIGPRHQGFGPGGALEHGPGGFQSFGPGGGQSFGPGGGQSFSPGGGHSFGPGGGQSVAPSPAPPLVYELGPSSSITPNSIFTKQVVRTGSYRSWNTTYN